MLTRPTAFAALAALASPALAGDLLIVDPTAPPGTFATIQLAVDAAGDGDVVLVRSGQYQSFFVVGKGVDVVADQFANVLVAGGPRLANVPAGSRVLLHGLSVIGEASPTLFAGRGLTALDSLGAIRVQDTSMDGADNLSSPPDCQGIGDDTGWDGALLHQCHDVAFVGSHVEGGRGTHQADSLGCPKFTPGGWGGHGVDALGGSVAVYDSTLIGGAGGRGGWGGQGGSGLSVQDGVAFVAATSATGGVGGIGIDWLFGPGGDGGDGVTLAGLSSGTLLDVTAAGGAGGVSFLFSNGAPGEPVSGGPPVVHPGPARHFDSPTPVREGTSLTLAFEGEPGDLALVAFGPADLAAPLPAFQGVLHVSAPQVKVVGFVPGSGSLGKSIPVGPLPVGEGALTLPLQGVVLSATLELVLSTPRHQVIVDADA